MVFKKQLSAALAVLMFSPVVFAEAWDGANNPTIFDNAYEYRLDVLPLKGKVEGHTPWSDDYWPLNKAIIARRYQVPNTDHFKYKTYSRSELLGLDEDSRTSLIKKMSPAEKFDLLNGNYTYPLVEQSRKWGSKGAADWAGICQGWSPAAIHHPQPQPVTVVNKDGISIPFGSSDIKGILSYYYAVKKSKVVQVGLRCRGGIFRLGGNCKDDVNPGALHVILANELGLKGESFIMDKEQFKEVWNQPVHSFSSHVRSQRYPTRREAKRGISRVITVATQLNYVDEVDSTFEAKSDKDVAKILSLNLLYDLEIDYQGKISGGEWRSGSDQWPDFIWKKEKLNFEGSFEALNLLSR
jgi:hypothetical protein